MTNKRVRQLRVLTVSVCAAIALSVIAADSFAPNHFLGTCLDEVWVSQMESSLGISADARDAQGRRVHPFLHEAVKQPRFRVHDQRTAATNVYPASALSAGAILYGVGAVVNATDGAVLHPGDVNGSLIVELSGWTTHSLTTLAFSILVREVYGYPVSHFYVTDTLTITQRMSSVLSGLTTPTHANLEVWITGIESQLQVYSNESFSAGGVGYFGRSGLYTSVDFINDSLPLFASYWQSYQLHDTLINAVPVSTLRDNAAFFPPLEVGCGNNSFGCLDHCSKTYACTLRETKQPPEECMVVAMMYDYYDPGYLQAVLANLDIPTYFCFLGYSGMQDYVLDAQQRRQPVLFYHFEPDLFHFHHKGKFDRVFLPRPIPERVAMATGTFGELGYGKETANPVNVDFASTKLSKYAAMTLQAELPLVRLITQFALSELDINDLLRRYLDASTPVNGSVAEPDPVFRAACEWVKHNYNVWSLWLERLPLCTLADHILYDISGCAAKGEEEEDDGGVRIITFRWRMPDPGSPLLPYNCDGGLTALPAPIHSSRSCDWILGDPSRWAAWVYGKPECDSRFYSYEVSACDATAKRSIHYAWLLPDPLDATMSLECDGGAVLPANAVEDCDYMPHSSSAFIAIASANGALVAVLVLAMGFVYTQRNAQIIKRSQYELLLVMLGGGLLVCAAIVLYAGQPTRFLCGARPAFMSMGFTTIFGALLVKSLRVYRVFMRAAFKKNTVTVSSMVRVLVAVVLVDVLVLMAWYVLDFPEPTTKLRRSLVFDGFVSDVVCASSSFIFTALMFFWKAIVLCSGLYISFLIRNVSTDFQESLWTFGACLVVLVGCVVILPLAYLVDLAPSTFYLFLAVTLIACTAMVMAMMVLPKVLRFRSATVHTSNSSGKDAGTRNQRLNGRADMSRRSITSEMVVETTNASEVAPFRVESTREATPVVPIGPSSTWRTGPSLS